ncbi:MAG: hypothetical protein ABF461_07445 [Zymomonas mobilis subsp. pomaceae]|uniref:Lipoprotein n=1 Tax=Zymomonas mobilis subsp. pomaceae (strain ATCC 29192 / DSM 22645 / JCM 10191 / CCUG 17912 / NBRC 13757 / NCIMB 11200 / NRRL B-4491 / Barker I) TaxID=579138 RepID=F8EV33_ZYMMT|nr:hypothetical protein [Zymomonas mobilis]AEI38251.1 hypothetical protein Zymop_1361 [Zymomonas mobilis subsp. pomaceae ATCC 29192]MDX5947940.1 hypothetical protein [Zymomonas mobilis subsp. pomaceae]GEB89269.1 hypothetical protein ZMO02_09060 [Zymomonas mobilis subsp. pomaceae]
MTTSYRILTLKALGLGLFLISGLSLEGCGQRGSLSIPAGHAKPVQPETARQAMDKQDLMNPPTQARPGRRQDLLLHSDVRTEDYFDLPPR